MLLVDSYVLGVKASGRVWFANTRDGARGEDCVMLLQAKDL